MDSSIIALIISVGCGIIFGTIAYLLAQRDKQRQVDLDKLEALIKETAKLVLDEKDKTARLVLNEKDKLANAVKQDYDKLDEKFTQFRIKIAEEYTTTALLKEITRPLLEKLNEIEKLLHTKVDRQEFDEHRRKADNN